MENNKFNKFYNKKSVSNLIDQIRSHRITGNTMDKDWYEALIKHLTERYITDEERKIVDHILSDDFDKIKELETLNNQKIEFEKVQKTQNHSNLMINPSNIISAGRNIKGVVYVVLVMTLFAIIAILTANSSRDLDTIKNTYLFLGAASLICNIIILFQLHSAGDNLENSVYKKEE
jgi:hypothetical protein